MWPTSNSAARRLIAQGAVRVNDRRISDIRACVSAADFDERGHALLRLGKKHAVILCAGTCGDPSHDLL